MTFFKSSLKLTLLSLLAIGIAVPAFAKPDFDNGIRFATNRLISSLYPRFEYDSINWRSQSTQM